MCRPRDYSHVNGSSQLFLYDLTVYAFKAYIVVDITDPEGDNLQYILMAVMFAKEIWIYFDCVRRAEKKLQHEKFNTGLSGGL